MKCKNCGGELRFRSGVCVCQSCGVTFSLESVYENIDACICYEENDEAGRRTKDSIVAQEVYRKLEENKVATFYERISADGMTGSDLEKSKLEAIYRAKIIIVLGTSVENFAAIEAKYGEYFNGKAVIPFCVDVNPSAIPKTLSKIQAISYSTIGWDKDLIKGVYNILGKEQVVDTVALYGHRKNKIILLSTIIAIIIIVAIMVCFVFGLGRTAKDPSGMQTQETTESTKTTESTGTTLTNSEIYKKAQELLSSGKYLEAAEEFNKVFDYKDSASQIKKIYDRYDGYYQDDEKTCSLYINIVDAETIEFSFEKTIDIKTVKAEDSMILDDNQATGTYIDNLRNVGTISISLTDENIVLNIFTEEVSNQLFFGEINYRFEIKNKTDRPPIKAVTKELLVSWLSSPTSIEDIITSGYELEYMPAEGEFDFRFGNEYKISNTNIIVITTDEDLTKYNGEYLENPNKLDSNVVVAIIAPANLVCEDKIGGRAKAFTKDDSIFVPNASSLMKMYDSNRNTFLNLVASGTMETFDTTPETRTMSKLDITSDSMVGMSSKKVLGIFYYNTLLSEKRDIYYRTLVLQQYQQDNANAGYTLVRILAETDDALLICVHDRNLSNGLDTGRDGSFNYYRLDISTEASSFIVKHKQVSYINSYGSRQYVYDDWKKYPELFGEFLSITWSELDAQTVEEALARKAEYLIRQKYSLDTNTEVSCDVETQNETFFLLCAHTSKLSNAYMTAWYKGNKETGEVVFLREGPYRNQWVWNENTEMDEIRIAEYLWFKEYSDFANEFPDYYGTPGEEGACYFAELPYSISFYNEAVDLSVFSGPSYDSNYISDLPIGDNVVIIVEQQYDETYRFWGKLSTGEGWICLSDIWVSFEWEYNP